MCVGDIISQKVVEKSERLDVMRTVRFGAIGFVMVVCYRELFRIS